MKAAVLRKYDKRSTLVGIEDVPVPVPGPDEVLVRVLTAGVNPLDNMIAHGDVKLIVPYPIPLVMGNEIVGAVEQVGAQVTAFAPGDRVYGRMPLDSIGAFAEYAAVRVDALALVPDYLSDEEAACVPLTALTAQQAYDLMQVQPGGSLFISGGTGSVGAMAIPLAKARGLHVFTSGSAKNEQRVRELGVDTFIDYHKQKPAEVLHDVDYVLDTLGDAALPEEFQMLKPGGTLVSLRGLPNGAFARRTGMPWLKRVLFSLAGRKYDAMAAKKDQRYQFIFVHADGKGLADISRVFEEKHIRPYVDEVFPLDNVLDAMQKVASGGSRGKTVLKVSER